MKWLPVHVRRAQAQKALITYAIELV